MVYVQSKTNLMLLFLLISLVFGLKYIGPNPPKYIMADFYMSMRCTPKQVDFAGVWIQYWTKLTYDLSFFPIERTNSPVKRASHFVYMFIECKDVCTSTPTNNMTSYTICGEVIQKEGPAFYLRLMATSLGFIADNDTESFMNTNTYYWSKQDEKDFNQIFLMRTDFRLESPDYVKDWNSPVISANYISPPPSLQKPKNKSSYKQNKVIDSFILIFITLFF